MGWKGQTFDCVAALVTLCIGPFTRMLANRRSSMPITRRVLDYIGVSYIQHHYYEPIVLPEEIRHDLAEERSFPALDMNVEEQLATLRAFNYSTEIAEIAALPPSQLGFSFHQPAFGPGDAEYLYSMIRHCKPKKIIEVGCGHSTKMIRHAVERNSVDDTAYTCEHICIEPYENPWLEDLGIEVIRQPVQNVDLNLFGTLGANDILFINSSHVIKPQGDVVFLYLMVLPQLSPGVYVHSHDILTPRDYFPVWVLNDRRMWSEQYLLEAFLMFNPAFKITGALNWLWHNYRSETHRAFPILAKTHDDDPGSFWLRRVHSTQISPQKSTSDH